MSKDSRMVPKEIRAALERFLAGQCTSDDITVLRRAFSFGDLTISAEDGGVAVGGDVRNSIIVTGGNLTFVLTAEAIERLLSVKTIPQQAPSLPQYYVPRPEIYGDLLESLLKAPSDDLETLWVSAVHGLGGIGKTTLVAHLAQNIRLRLRFPDGVLRVTLGQHPPLLSQLHEWVRALDDYQFVPLTLDGTTAHLRTLLNNKACLLLIDDAWDAEHIRPFLVGGPACRVLITTRDASLARKVGAKLYNLDVMSSTQALALFETRLGPLGMDRDLAAELAKEIGYLPLAIELAAAQIEDGRRWDSLLAAFRQGLADLAVLDLDDAKHRNESLRLSFRLSLDPLSPEEQTAFAWLGVLPEDAQINPLMAATLWNCIEETAAKRLLRFRNKALLKLVGEAQYSVHDLLHDEAKLRLAGEMPLKQAHSALLERYRAKVQNDLWHTLPDDRYIHEHLVWHLEQAGRFDEIHHLLGEETSNGRNGWYEIRNQLDQVDGYLSDIASAWRIAESELVSQDGSDNLHLLFRYAVIRTSLNSLTLEHSGEIYRGLLEHHALSVEQVLAAIYRIPDPESRFKKFLDIQALLPAEFRSQVLLDAKKICDQFSDPVMRNENLVRLLPYLPRDLGTEVTRQIMQSVENLISQPGSRLVERLPLPLWVEMLQYVKPSTKKAVIQRILCEECQPESIVPETLQQLARILTEQHFAELLDILARIKTPSRRINVLEPIVPYLGEHLLQKALQLEWKPNLPPTKSLMGDQKQVSALLDLGKDGIRNDFYPAGVLGAHSMRERMKILKRTRADSSQENYQAGLWDITIPFLTPGMIQDVVMQVRTFENMERQAEILVKSAKRHIELGNREDASRVALYAEESISQLADTLKKVRLLFDILEALPKRRQDKALAMISGSLAKFNAENKGDERIPPPGSTSSIVVRLEKEDRDKEEVRVLQFRELAFRARQTAVSSEKLAFVRSAWAVQSPKDIRAILDLCPKPLAGEFCEFVLQVLAEIVDVNEQISASLEAARYLDGDLKHSAVYTAYLKAQDLIDTDPIPFVDGLAEWQQLPEALRKDGIQLALRCALDRLHSFHDPTLLLRIAAFVEEPARSEALRTALRIGDRRIGDSYAIHKALKAIAPYLPQGHIPQAMETLSGLLGEWEIVEIFVEVVARVTDPAIRAVVVQSGFETIRRMSVDEWWQVEALVKILPYLNDTLLMQVLEIVVRLSNPESQARAYQVLSIRWLEVFGYEAALELIFKIKSLFFRSTILSDLAKKLVSIHCPDQANDALQRIADKDLRDLALLEISYEMIDIGYYNAANTAVSQITNPGWRHMGKDYLSMKKTLPMSVFSENEEVSSGEEENQKALDSRGFDEIIVQLHDRSTGKRSELLSQVSVWARTIADCGKSEKLVDWFLTIQKAEKWWP